MSAVVIGLLTTTGLLLRADFLRKESDSNHQLAMKKSRQLVGAVDDLLVSVSETPEIKLPGMEPLRRELLERANGFYASFLEETPDDSGAGFGTHYSLADSAGQTFAPNWVTAPERSRSDRAASRVSYQKFRASVV